MGLFLGDNMHFAKVVDKNISDNELEKVIDDKAAEDLKLVEIVDLDDIKILYFKEFTIE